MPMAPSANLRSVGLSVAGMDLRDEVSGTEGTIWLNHFLRTGFEMFTANGMGGYVAEKSESERGWLFPVGDELTELGYVPMFSEMFDAWDAGQSADGNLLRRLYRQCHYGCGLSLGGLQTLGAGGDRGVARADEADQGQLQREYDAHHWLVKEEMMPDGSVKLILKEKSQRAHRTAHRKRPRLGAMKTIRIGYGAGYSGDRLEPTLDLMEHGELHYIIFQCLAERTIALAQQQKARHPEQGYNELLDYRMRRVLPLAAAKGVKVITNMGAADPLATLWVVKELAHELGITGLRLAAVWGMTSFPSSIAILTWR